MDRYNAIMISINRRMEQLEPSELTSLNYAVYVGKQELEALIKVATERSGETHPKKNLRLNGMQVIEVDAETHLALGYIIQEQGYWE